MSLETGGVRLGLAARLGLLEQFAELDLRRPFGLADAPQPDLSARQRVSPGLHLDTPGPTRQLLHVSGRGLRREMTVDQPRDQDQ
jgi:hypothetical protein